jgi:hypothetical protein
MARDPQAMIWKIFFLTRLLPDQVILFPRGTMHGMRPELHLLSSK